MYQNGDSNVKQMLRSILAKKIPLSKKFITVLSLPANNFLFEKLLEEMYPTTTFRFVCLEKNKEVYQEGIEVLESGFIKNHVQYLNMSTSEYLASTKYEIPVFDLVWLDYCGQMCPYMLEDFESVEGCTADDSVVAITLMGKREQKNVMDSFRDLLPEKVDLSNQDIREELFSAKIQQLIDLKTESIYKYIDSSDRQRVSPMYLYVFKDHPEDKKKVYNLTFNSRIEEINKFNI
jgi:hypothetical protein